MFRFLVNSTKIKIAELKALHAIEINKKEADIKLLKENAQQEIEMKTREMQSLLKLKHDQQIAEIEMQAKKETATIALAFEKKANELEAKKNDEIHEIKEKLMLEYQEKLAEALSKLHSEGNHTTKFVQDLALQMIGKQPTTKLETKVITKSCDE